MADNTLDGTQAPSHLVDGIDLDNELAFGRIIPKAPSVVTVDSDGRQRIVKREAPSFGRRWRQSTLPEARGDAAVANILTRSSVQAPVYTGRGAKRKQVNTWYAMATRKNHRARYRLERALRYQQAQRNRLLGTENAYIIPSDKEPRIKVGQIAGPTIINTGRTVRVPESKSYALDGISPPDPPVATKPHRQYPLAGPAYGRDELPPKRKR